MLDPFGLLRDVIKDAKDRVPGGSPIDMETMAAEKEREWKAKGVPAGIAQAAIDWALKISRGWVSKLPEGRREEMIREIFPRFLEEAETKFIPSLIKALREAKTKVDE